MEVVGPMAGKWGSVTISAIIRASRPWSPRNVTCWSKLINLSKSAADSKRTANGFLFIKLPSFATIVIMFRRIQPYCIISAVVLLSTLVLWLPFLLHAKSLGPLVFPNGISLYDVYKNWDGVLYIVVAKTFYNIQNPILQDRLLALPLSPQYFAAHLPLYPFLIWLGSFILGYLKSM